MGCDIRRHARIFEKENSPNLRSEIPFPPDNRKITVQHAKDAGAIGIIFIPNDYHFNNWGKTAESYRDFYTIPETGQVWVNTALPVVLIDSAMIEYLFTGQKYNPLKNNKTYKSFELKDCEFTLFKEYTTSTINTVNVIGLIEGSDRFLK